MQYPFPHQVNAAYTSAIRQRLDEGVFVLPSRVSIGDWEPQANHCHDNVTFWCNSKPEFQAVRGWLYMDMSGQFEYEVFLAHSVVRDSDGQLWDITPMQALERYPFFAATESEDEYHALMEQGATRLVHHK